MSEPELDGDSEEVVENVTVTPADTEWVEKQAVGIEAWEDELEGNLQDVHLPEKCSWTELREQIKTDLQKYKILSLSQINQLLILRNFATLIVKGSRRIEASFKIARQWHEKTSSCTWFAQRIRSLAHHYETSKQLPQEYWGWCKYRYRQAPKNTFEDAKKAAYQAFDACPTDVIHCFINRSFRFMSAYHQGLTGKAAEWAVRKQKGHWKVSQGAMMHIETIVS
ncbi:hypothetical protein AN958_11655 [Leucoagaricus sp. SymC.cos]|nr:hypothetical protein AN958_11655 [Leucoagaricus sp. SymC.cos]